MICFFSENGHEGYADRNWPSLRTEFAWQIALDAWHENVYRLSDGQYECGILIIPKRIKNHPIDFDAIKAKCKRLAIMQEGPHDFYQNYDVVTQQVFREYMNHADFLLCHNEYDRKYYAGMFDKPCYVLPSLLLEESLNGLVKKKKAERAGTMVGGTYCQWYSGMDSVRVAEVFKGQVSIPCMGRLQDQEIETNTHINYMPWCHLNQFLGALNGRRYAVHLMRTYAAGTFALACGRLQVPCIGYNHVDTQRLIYPKLSVDQGDIEGAREIAHKLVHKQGFYEHVIENGLKNYAKHFSEDNWLRQESVKVIKNA